MRLRKERPTMMWPTRPLLGISVEGIKAAGLRSLDGTYAVPDGAALDPIRCTFPVPCGHCYYCKLHEARNG